MQAQRISRALAEERNSQRPVYMVIRHLGVEPADAIHALFAAGFRPSEYGVLCSDLTDTQRDHIKKAIR